MDNTQNSPPSKRKSLKDLVLGSVIITLLSRLASLIYKKLDSGIFGALFTSYDRENEAVGRSALASLFGRLDLQSRILRPLKSGFSRLLEESLIFSKIRNSGERMLTCQVKVYGLFLFSFALYAALVHIAKVFLLSGGEGTVDAGVIITLILMVIASVGLIAARGTLAEALLSSTAVCFFLTKIVGIRRESLEKLGECDGRLNLAFAVGLVFGLASYFVSPLILLLLIFGAIGALLVMISPEFGVVAIITVLPFAPTMGLVAAVLYTWVCMFFKVLRGKRSITFDLLDGVVLAFMGYMVFGGVVALSSASAKPMLVYVAFMSGYFLVVNLIRSREWITRCVVGIMTSGTVVALYGLFQNYFGLAEQTWQDSDMFSQIEGRVVSTFENPNVLAEYLIMILPLMFVAMLLSKGGKSKLICLAAIASAGGCLIYTWSRGAWLGFMIGMLIFFLMYSKNTLTAILFCTFGIPFLPLVLPESIVQRFTSIGNLGDSSTSYRVYIWQGVGNMLRDTFFGGIGIGTDSFKLVYPRYALSGIESAPHSHNLYLQILVELGVFGLIVFVALLFIWVQSCFTLHANENRRTKLISTALFTGLLAVLAQGMTDYIWYNYRVYLMFWLLLGLSAAVRKVHRYTAEENII